jgi:bifunctional DNase/RNase
MTHDLLKNIMDAMRVEVIRVEVNDLVNNTFYARISLRQGEENYVMDARPSDAIAVALRTKAPIFVARNVMEKSRKIDLASESTTDEARKQKWTEILENLSPEDFGKYKM